MGIQAANDVVSFLKGHNMKCHYEKFEKEIQLDKKLIIEVLSEKYFSSFRYIPDDIHKQTLEYLRKNNYFTNR